MEDLSKLRHLSLVSKICAELENHIGFSDKTLAEFIIEIANSSTNPKAFYTSLKVSIRE